MGDRFDAVTGVFAGLMGYAVGLGLLQTLVVLLLTHAIHGFVMGWMGWKDER